MFTESWPEDFTSARAEQTGWVAVEIAFQVNGVPVVFYRNGTTGRAELRHSGATDLQADAS